MSEAFFIGQIKLYFTHPPDFLGSHLINLCSPHPRASWIVASVDQVGGAIRFRLIAFFNVLLFSSRFCPLSAQRGAPYRFSLAKLIHMILVCKCFGYFNYNLTYKNCKCLVLNTYLQNFTLALIVENFPYLCLCMQVLNT